MPIVLPLECNIYIISSVCVPTNLQGGWQGTVRVQGPARSDRYGAETRTSAIGIKRVYKDALAGF